MEFGDFPRPPAHPMCGSVMPDGTPTRESPIWRALMSDERALDVRGIDDTLGGLDLTDDSTPDRIRARLRVTRRRIDETIANLTGGDDA